ncbi:hypothetical protein [Kushneria indalinina]|uniref:Uncharacterized protein n=1 Tax=Kushneria indalinina DSM 14324 TaxID=1122140 RepID=A0A3D9DRJ4_9GAMM|nr:hypothetical protein [Kushneria indalinina]REC93312.1 hypothetical protein C8D72_3468 [Kushneria indalinina DSM 14324]
MDDEFETRLEERWQDYQAAVDSTIANLKADPANRHAHPKAWVGYVAKMVLFSLVGSAASLIALYVAMPQVWAGSSVGLVFNIWCWASMIGLMFSPLVFSPPVRYWEQRADRLLEGTDVPPKHKAF